MSTAITCVFKHAALAHGPASQRTGTPYIASVKVAGMVGATMLRNFGPLQSIKETAQWHSVAVSSTKLHNAARTSGSEQPDATISRSRFSPAS